MRIAPCYISFPHGPSQRIFPRRPGPHFSCQNKQTQASFPGWDSH
jgi:hypothetical protein